jgi:DNA repair protein RadC
MKTTHLFELKKIQSNFPQTKVLSSKVAADFIRQFYTDDIEVFESCFILLLNRASNTIGYAKISQGGISGTVIDPRIVAKYAIDALATSVIIAHNHPSGQLIPSDADKAITTKLINGLKLLDITLLDHCILTSESYYSFADNDQLI